MGVGTTAERAIAKAEEDVHVAGELEQARQGEGYQDPMSLDELRNRAKQAGGSLGGLQSSAELMTIYNRYDGLSSEITTDQAGQRLRVRFDATHPWAGQLVWTTKRPDTAPPPGTLKCPLHLDSEDRDYMNSLNFGGVVCRKSNMKTEMDRQDHFQNKHKKIYKAVEADKARQLQLQQMDLMREQTNAMKAMAARQGADGAQPEPVATEAPTAQEPQAEPEPAPEPQRRARTRGQEQQE